MTVYEYFLGEIHAHRLKEAGLRQGRLKLAATVGTPCSPDVVGNHLVLSLLKHLLKNSCKEVWLKES